jgi:hypothetical protein
MDTGRIPQTRFTVSLSNSRPTQVNSSKLRRNRNTRRNLIDQSPSDTTKPIVKDSSLKLLSTNYKLK